MWRLVYLPLLFTSLFFGCSPEQIEYMDIQGHRGARGYLPENTIPSFILALESGVKTLEMDVVVSADGKLVVSHEPWMSAEICSHPDGRHVTEEDQMNLNLYRMSYEEIAKYDCGSRGNARFPQQKVMAVTKPLLSAVIDTIESIVKSRKLPPIFYNIETKTESQGDNLYHPAPAQFVKLLLDELKKHGIENRTTVQSFDVRTLQEMLKLDGKISLALLVSEGAFSAHLDTLGFIPEIYSPNYKLVTDTLMKEAQEKGVQVIPWTVNDSLEMKRLIDLGVDGFITDYPEVGVKISKSYDGKGQRQTVQ